MRIAGMVTNATPDQDDEFLLDAPEVTSADLDTILPPSTDNSEMHIDEEGRPRFAPAKNIVRLSIYATLQKSACDSNKNNRTQQPESKVEKFPFLHTE